MKIRLRDNKGRFLKENRQLQTYTCDFCQKIFKEYSSQRVGNKKFCSRGCCWSYEKLNQTLKIRTSEDLAYVLGVYYGDGTIEDIGQHGKRIMLFSVTPEFNACFEKSLRSIGLNPFRDFLDRAPKPICGKKVNKLKRVYRTVCYSTKLYELIERLGFKKNVDVEGLQRLIFSERGYIINFLRGFYESDGSYSRCGRGRQLYIGVTNKKLIQFAKYCTSLLGFKFRLNEEDRSKKGYKTLYRICLTRYAEVTKFLETINPCIKRGD